MCKNPSFQQKSVPDDSSPSLLPRIYGERLTVNRHRFVSFSHYPSVRQMIAVCRDKMPLADTVSLIAISLE